MLTAMLALGVLAATPRPAPSVAATAPAPVLRFALSAEFNTHWRLDRSYRVFSDDRSAAATGVSLSYDVMRLSGRSVLAPYLSFRQDRQEKTERSREGARAAALEERAFEAGAIFRMTLWRWLEPHLRLGAEARWVEARLGLQDGSALAGSAFSPGVIAGGGFRLRTGSTRLTMPGRPAVGAAAAIEGGFAAGPPMPLRLRQPEPANEAEARDRIATAPVDAGTLDRAEPYVRLSLSLLF